MNDSDLQAELDAMKEAHAALVERVEELERERDIADPKCEGRCSARASDCKRNGQCCGKCTHR